MDLERQNKGKNSERENRQNLFHTYLLTSEPKSCMIVSTVPNFKVKLG
jgi:hypothetical protein